MSSRPRLMRLSSAATDRRRLSAATDRLLITCIERALAPALRQQMVEHVVDGHRTEQVVVVVDDRGCDQVVRRQIAGDERQRRVRTKCVDVRVGDTGYER